MQRDITDQEAEVLLLRDTYRIHKIRHTRTMAKFHKQVQFRGLCRCCGADPVVIAVVRERGAQKRLCGTCYKTALDLYREAASISDKLLPR